MSILNPDLITTISEGLIESLLLNNGYTQLSEQIFRGKAFGKHIKYTDERVCSIVVRPQQNGTMVARATFRFYGNGHMGKITHLNNIGELSSYEESNVDVLRRIM